MSKSVKLLIIALLCLNSLGFLFKSSIVNVNVSKKRVETGEIFAYKVKIEGDFSNPKVVMPEFKDFNVASQKQTKSYAIKKGKARLTLDLTYFLFAYEPGVFTIQPVTVTEGEKEYKSRSIKIKVIGEPLGKKKKILPYIKEGTKI